MNNNVHLKKRFFIYHIPPGRFFFSEQVKCCTGTCNMYSTRLILHKVIYKALFIYLIRFYMILQTINPQTTI